jgi:AMMECR1 domain-containing protein
LTPDVVDGATVGIDVVGPLTPVPVSNYEAIVDAVVVGRDGLVLALEGNTFTFLPDVWQTSRDAADFVALLWRKAGLEPGALPTRSRLATFTTETYDLPLVS